MHALKSIFQPWDLKFRREYEAIEAEAQQIRRLADIALKAEVRSTRLEVVEGTRHWELVRQEMDELRIENQRLASLFQAKFGTMEDSMLCEWSQTCQGQGRSSCHNLNQTHLSEDSNTDRYPKQACTKRFALTLPPNVQR